MEVNERGGKGGALLRWGMVVGPFYLAIGLAQALTRDGFDLGRHALSILANGPGGWIQTANFVLSGLMVVAAAVGIERSLRPHSRASGWILACFGISMLVAAIFPADPVDGFPPGTPEGFPTSISTPGVIHFVAGALGFLALAVSCITVASALSRRGDRRAAMVSFVAGVSVLAGFFAPALVPAAGPVAGIWFSVVVGWGWLAWLSSYLNAKRTLVHASTGSFSA